MPAVQLSLATLGELDNGITREIIDREIDRVVQDLEDRGAEDGKPREVVIVVRLAIKDKLAVVEVEAKAKLPSLRSGATAAKIRQAGGEIGLLFQTRNAENPDQSTLEDHLEKENE